MNPDLDFNPRFLVTHVYPGYPPQELLQFGAFPGIWHPGSREYAGLSDTGNPLSIRPCQSQA